MYLKYTSVLRDDEGRHQEWTFHFHGDTATIVSQLSSTVNPRIELILGTKICLNIQNCII